MCPYCSLLKKLCQLQLQVKFDTICHLITPYIIYVIRTFTTAITLQVMAQDLSIQLPTFLTVMEPATNICKAACAHTEPFQMQWLK